jgi:hypothetical protein
MWWSTLPKTPSGPFKTWRFMKRSVRSTNRRVHSTGTSFHVRSRLTRFARASSCCTSGQRVSDISSAVRVIMRLHSPNSSVCMHVA